MARKGQKFNKYSSELKLEILNKYLSNQGSFTSLAKEYEIPIKTIKNWVCKHRKGKDISVDHRPLSSGQKKQEDIDYKERYEILKKYQIFLKEPPDKK